MFTVWICIECLHRVLRSELLWTKRLSCLMEECQKEKQTNRFLCQKKGVNSKNIFKQWLEWWREGTSLAFISDLFLLLFTFNCIFSPQGDVNVLFRDSSVVLIALSCRLGGFSRAMLMANLVNDKLRKTLKKNKKNKPSHGDWLHGPV